MFSKTCSLPLIHKSNVLVQVLWKLFYRNENIEEAIESTRVHHQLSPNELQVEETLDPVTKISKISVWCFFYFYLTIFTSYV